MNAYSAIWSGEYPNLCYGFWTLYKNGEPMKTDIPFAETDAETYGTYSRWSFNSDWEEEWEEYEDGLSCAEWIMKYKDWLSSIAPKDDWENIYNAFTVEDFRRGECGGCI